MSSDATGPNYHDFSEVKKGNDAETSLLVRGEKQGHKCCGGCCDVRRAVIIVNLINAGLILIAIPSLVGMKQIVQSTEYQDDQVQQDMREFNNLSLGPSIAILAVYFLVHLIGIGGAVIYNKWMVGICAVSYCISLVSNVIFLNPVGAIVAGLYAYPHIFLVKEIHQGTMTKANYPNEEHSCCCV